MDKGLHMQLMDQKYLRGDGLTGNFWSQLRTGGCNLGSNSRADRRPASSPDRESALLIARSAPSADTACGHQVISITYKKDF